MDRIPLGKSDVHISPLGLGTWAWGDTSMWGYGKSFGDDDLEQAYRASLEPGMRLIDTAEGYAQGRSERILGRFIRESSTREQVIIATKFSPRVWRFFRKQLISALRKSLKRMNLSYVDLYQIHWPGRRMSIETFMYALVDVIEAGLTRAVGVSNFSVEETKRAHSILANSGVPLASNQIRHSLLHRTPEKNGMFELCRELGVTIIAHSPLHQGMLTGKYTPEHLPPGPRSRQYNREFLTKIQPLLSLMKEIGQAHEGKSPAQVALNWTISKGAVPIPGATNLGQAKENLGALGWRLSVNEIRVLDEASESLIQICQ